MVFFQEWSPTKRKFTVWFASYSVSLRKTDKMRFSSAFVNVANPLTSSSFKNGLPPRENLLSGLHHTVWVSEKPTKCIFLPLLLMQRPSYIVFFQQWSPSERKYTLHFASSSQHLSQNRQNALSAQFFKCGTILSVSKFQLSSLTAKNRQIAFSAQFLNVAEFFRLTVSLKWSLHKGLSTFFGCGL